MESTEEFEIVPIGDFQKNFDYYLNEIETLGKSIVVEDVTGNRVAMVPATDDDVIKIHTEHNDAC